MIKITRILLVFMFFSLNSFSNETENFQENIRLESLPIIHEGRVKPLDTYARNLLKRVYGKEKLKDQSAIEWIRTVLTESKKAYKEEIFKINDPAILNILKLKKKSYFHYSFSDVYEVFSKNSELILKLSENESNLSIQEKNILQLYTNFLEYLNISRSLSLFYRQFPIKNLIISDQEKISNKELKFLSLYDLYVFHLLDAKEVQTFINFIYEDRQFTMLKIYQSKLSSKWISPWELLEENHENPFLIELNNFYHQNSHTFSSNSHNFKLNLEVFSNKASFLKWANIFFILSFFFFTINYFLSKKMLDKIQLLFAILGSFLLFIQICIRSLILSRPPVSNLYESILFVNLVAVLVLLFLELKIKNNINGLFSSIIGSSFLFLAFGFEGTSDSMGMLVAVLDTSFWLSTHVLTISIGYSTTLVLALLGHLSLLQRSKLLPTSYNFEHSLYVLTLYSLFFTVLGTLLGGVWADQSWGRFWGWDPKENGALFLCLWLLFVLHGKINKRFTKTLLDLLYAVSGVVVIMAWFGVNLLNVGLHSYGFTENIEKYLILFLIIEIIVFILLGSRAYIVQEKSKAKISEE